MVPNKRVYLLDVVCAIIHVRTTATNCRENKKIYKAFIYNYEIIQLHARRHKFVFIPTRPCKKILPIVAGMNMSFMFLNIEVGVLFYIVTGMGFGRNGRRIPLCQWWHSNYYQ